jgi:hypothetical protein
MPYTDSNDPSWYLRRYDFNSERDQQDLLEIVAFYRHIKAIASEELTYDRHCHTPFTDFEHGVLKMLKHTQCLLEGNASQHPHPKSFCLETCHYLLYLTRPPRYCAAIPTGNQ